MKRIYIYIFIVILLFFNTLQVCNAQTNAVLNKSNSSANPETSQLILGYCSTTANSQLGYASSTVKAGVLFPETLMKKYVGNQIVKLKIAIGSNAVTSNDQIFITYDKAGTPFYT